MATNTDSNLVLCVRENFNFYYERMVIFYEYGSELLCRGLYEVDQKEISVDTYIYHTESSFCRRTVYA